MRKLIGVSAGSLVLYALPYVALAQGSVDSFLVQVQRWVSTLVVILVILAVVVFFWGLIKYLSAVGDEKHKGLMIMFYGILTIFVMVALWGLVGFFAKTLNINPGTAAPAIQVPGQHYE